MAHIIVREHHDVGAESTWPPIAGAVVHLEGGTKIDDITIADATTGADGAVQITDFKLSASKDGFHPYAGVYPESLLREPGAIPVSLWRR